MQEETLPVQISNLIVWISETENVYKTGLYSKKGNENDFDTVLMKFEAHIILKKNVTHENVKFHSRAKNCVFENNNEEIKNRFVIELEDKRQSERLRFLQT